MRINLLTCVSSGRELLNLMIDKTSNYNNGVSDHWADVVLRSKWCKGEIGEQLLCFSPFKTNLVIGLKKRKIHIHLAVEFLLSKGACEVGLHLFVMLEDLRRELN